VKILATRRRGAAYSRKTEAGRSEQQRNTREDGYILLTLVLIIALMAVVVTAVIIPLKFSMQRDQEEEMIHRGVQYSRAIRGYYKKFGRYPTRLEDLDNTNNLKYLRKHYKDPMNKNQDFKLLHFGDPGLSLTGSIAGGMIAGATPAGAINGAGSASGSFGGSSSSFGGGSSSFGGSSSAFGGGNSSFGGTGSSLGGGSSSSSSGVNSNGVFAQASGNGTGTNSQTATGEPGAASGSDSSQGTGQGDGSGNQLIASGPIVGVASLSKKSTIREFNHKYKYNDWQFIYDPASDHGGLITTPNQPSLQTLGGIGTPAGQAGNSSSSPFGQSSSGQSAFGQPSSGQSSFGQSSFGQSSFGSSSSGSGSQQQSQPNPQPPQ
jgi:type II secretory pathway pseudopilin PulG